MEYIYERNALVVGIGAGGMQQGVGKRRWRRMTEPRGEDGVGKD